MADIKREQERDELHRTIWGIADELRGSVDGWDFKSYVLGIMFYRYISENLTNYINKLEHDAGNIGFEYALMSDEYAETARETLVESKGFFILPIPSRSLTSFSLRLPTVAPSLLELTSISSNRLRCMKE